MMKRTEKIKQILDTVSGIDAYRINTVSTKSHELFFVHKKLETVRSTDTADIKLSVFVEHDGKLGDASFSVYPSYDDETLRAKIEDAKKKAALISNEIYPMPGDECEFFESSSNMGKYDIKELAEKISNAVFASDVYDGGSINALEIFIYQHTVNVINSLGLNKTEVRYSAMIEAIPTWTTAEGSVELYECYNFTEFSEKAIREEIDAKMREVRARMLAKKPEEKITAPVILTAPELSSLIGELARELGYSKIYSKSNAFSIGDMIQKNCTGDALNVTMCASIKGSVASARFDQDGFTLRDKKLIENGQAIGAYGTVRYASYLGKEPTGALRCLKAECGSMSDEELSMSPYFKCVSMSGLQLDIYNDYIGGEVRLAYYFDGEREIPVTGISISGRLSDAISSMRLSDTETVYENYCGPKFAALFGIEIV